MDIYDASEHAGVPITTVSRILNGNANVSEKTREKILKIMDDLGYTPNVFARGFGLNIMQTTGIMCSDSSDPHLAGATYYLERGLRSHNYNAILRCTGYDLDAKQKYFELLCSKRVDAITLVGSRFVGMCSKGNTCITEAAADPLITLVNGYLEGDSTYGTVYDDHAAMFGTTTQLLQVSRRRILYLYTSYSYSGVSKLEGYKDAPEAFGMESKGELIRQCPRDMGVSKELLLSLREQGPSFGVVTTSSDSLVVGTVKYAHKAGTPIPEELNTIGYNSSILLRCTGPGITSIDSEVEVLCTTAVSTLMGVFSGVNVPSRTAITSNLIERKTTNF